MDPEGEDRGSGGVWSNGVGEESRKALMKGGGAKPEVKPEGAGRAITDGYLGRLPEGVEPRNDSLPNGGVQKVRVSQVTLAIPTITTSEPAGPRGSRGRVKFREEFSEESGILGGDGEDT
jgi:hypothetical protein